MPARAHRDGVREQSEARGRRRADHRARRHDSSADPAPDRRDAAAFRDRADLHHPRSAAGEPHLRPDHRDVCGLGGRDRAGARSVRDTRASLHPLPRACRSRDRARGACAVPAAGTDAGAAGARAHGRLSFCTTLPGRGGCVPKHAPDAGAGARGA